MKYLKDELYDACDIEDEDSMERWSEAFACYEKEFSQVRHRFPKRFLAEVDQGYGICDRAVRRIVIEEKKPNHFDLTLQLGKPEYNTIVLQNISALQINQVINQIWIHHEFLPIENGRISLEVAFWGGGRLYVEFKSLCFFRDKPHE